MKIKFNNLRLFLAVCLTRGGKKGNPKTEMSQKGGYYTPKYHRPHSLCVYVCIYMRKCAICHFSDCFLKLSSSSFSVSGSMAKVKVSVSISCNVMLCFSLVFFFVFFQLFARTIQQIVHARKSTGCYCFRGNTFARKLIECIFFHAALAAVALTENCQNTTNRNTLDSPATQVS